MRTVLTLSVLRLTCTPGFRAANLLRDVEWERQVGVGGDTLGEESLPPALAYDPVCGAGGRHHHNHSDEAAGEGDYLQDNDVSQVSHSGQRLVREATKLEKIQN